MTKTLWDVTTVAGATGCAVIGGVFFTFSGFVMPALTRLRGSRGLEAMKSINVTAQHPPLMIALFGTAALCVALAVHAIRNWGDRTATLLLLGAALYLVGAILTTIVVNVPINDKIAALSLDELTRWHDLARSWTWANHVRTALSIGAAVALVLAARSAGPVSDQSTKAATSTATSNGAPR